MSGVVVQKAYSLFVASPLVSGVRQPNFEKLAIEIEADAGITTALIDPGIRPYDMSVPDVGFQFAGALSGPEVTALDVLIGVHDGVPPIRPNNTGTHLKAGVPGASDDDTVVGVGGLPKYAVGDFMFDTTSGSPLKLYVASDLSTGAAVWTLQATGTGGGFPFYDWPASKLMSSNTANWAVNGNAPLVADSNDSGLSVRLSDDATEEGFGQEFTVPAGAENMQTITLARAETAPGGAVVAKPLIYFREITDGGAVGSWGSSIALTDIDLAANEFFVKDVTDKTLAAWGIAVGKRYQYQITRTSVSNTLNGDLAWKSIRKEFT